MIIKNGLVFGADQKFSNRNVYIKNNIIADDSYTPADPGEIIDAAGCYVLPGFVDMHTHGAMNFDFCDADITGIETMLGYYGSHGVTSVILTTNTYPEAVITDAVLAALPYFDMKGYGAVLRGVNLEGPFISYNKRGAQKPEYLMLPDIDFFKRVFDLSNGYVRLIDLAPELPGALGFIEKACKKCTVSLAHTEASYDEAAAAFDAGASSVTHLFNGMNAFTHRAPGVVGAAADKAAFIELISDGFHVHPAMVRAVFKIFGPERVCLISDSMRATGMPNGDYDIGGQIAHVEDGKSTLASDSATIAGSVVNLADMCRRAIGFGVPIEYVVRAATLNPAMAAGINKDVGSLQPGKRADVVIWDKDFNTKAVICAGDSLDCAASSQCR